MKQCQCSNDNTCDACIDRLEKNQSNLLAVSISEYLQWQHSEMVRKEENKQRAIQKRALTKRYKANGLHSH